MLKYQWTKIDFLCYLPYISWFYTEKFSEGYDKTTKHIWSTLSKNREEQGWLGIYRTSTKKINIDLVLSIYENLSSQVQALLPTLIYRFQRNSYYNKNSDEDTHHNKEPPNQPYKYGTSLYKFALIQSFVIPNSRQMGFKSGVQQDGWKIFRLFAQMKFSTLLLQEIIALTMIIIWLWQ